MKHITVYNRLLAKFLNIEEPHVFISISTPNDPEGPAHLGTNANTKGVLQLQFHDIDRVWAPDHNGQVLRVVRSDVESKMFHPHHARAILSFVAAHAEVERIIVHCDAGLSRSPGVAAALSRIYNEDDAEFFKTHSGLNRRVYRMILEEHFDGDAGETHNGDGHPGDQGR